MAMKQKNLPAIVPEMFNHEQFGQFRYIKRGEEIWFVGKDVAIALGYAKPADAVREHVPNKFKGVCEMETPGGNQKVVIISEAGLYRLAFSSKLPSAVKFTDWVCEEVLPSIRKYGYYSVKPPEQEKIYVEITGDENFKLFKKKYPEIDFEKALRRIGFTKIYDEHGYYHEEDVFLLRFNPDDYEKISRDPLSISCIEKTIPHKKTLTPIDGSRIVPPLKPRLSKPL